MHCPRLYSFIETEQVEPIIAPSFWREKKRTEKKSDVNEGNRNKYEEIKVEFLHVA
jgi:hypothetical protein